MQNISRFRPFVYSLPVGLALTPGIANALELGIEPRLQTGVMYYEFEQKLLSGIVSIEGNSAVQSFSELKFSDTMPFIGGGVTLFADRFFLDLYAQKAFSGEDDDTSTTSIDFIPQSSTALDADFDREDYAFAVGTAVTENIALFAGYKKSSTNFDLKGPATQFAIDPDTNTLQPQALGTLDQELDFDQDGFFFGGTWGTEISGDWPLAGFLSMNVAIAFLEGEAKTDKFTINGQSVDAPPNLQGDTAGINVGVSWKGQVPVVKGLNYTIALNGYRYDFDSNNTNRPDFTETVGLFSVGVSYPF